MVLLAPSVCSDVILHALIILSESSKLNLNSIRLLRGALPLDASMDVFRKCARCDICHFRIVYVDSLAIMTHRKL